MGFANNKSKKTKHSFIVQIVVILSISWPLEAVLLDAVSIRVDAADVEGSCRAVFAFYVSNGGISYEDVDSGRNSSQSAKKIESRVDDGGSTAGKALSGNIGTTNSGMFPYSGVVGGLSDLVLYTLSDAGMQKGNSRYMSGIDFALAVGIVSRILILSRQGQVNEDGRTQNDKERYALQLLLRRFQQSQSMLLEQSDYLQEVLSIRKHERFFQDDFIIPYEDILGAVEDLYVKLGNSDITSAETPLVPAEQKLASICEAKRDPLRLARRLRRAIGAHMSTRAISSGKAEDNIGLHCLSLLDSLAALSQLCGAFTGLDDQQACKSLGVFYSIRTSMEVLFLKSNRRATGAT
jgi:hypothetical protein